MAEVEFNNVNKIYNKTVKAVKNLSVTCKDKEFLAILGPSGCGKTSSLRMLAGLEEITSGDIMIKGKIVNNITPQGRNVAMSFENYGLYPSFTIFENIAYPLKIRKIQKDEIEKKVLGIANKLKLIDVLNQYPNSLSSGQKQRTSIARALVRNPDVTIMDEPLSHLDAKMRNYMRSEIKRLHLELGLTTIYVTHDQIEAMTMADKILVMNEGVAQQIGTPDDVYSKPNNLFVAGFIGSPQMNFITCKVDISRKRLVSEGDIDIYVDPDRYDLVEKENIIFGIRPHDISISREKIENYIKGFVHVIEPLGESTIITVKVGNLLIQAEAEGHLDDWTFDDEIFIKLDSEKGHLFNNADGNRIRER